MHPTQELAQKVCQRYGWSACIEKEVDGGVWISTIHVGIHDVRRFASTDHESDDTTEAGRKKGTAAASEAALEGLKEEIERQEKKPEKTLAQVFPEPIDVYESNRENWDYFWKHKPKFVGIDVEGNQISPPVLVQIATDEYTIIEVPCKGRLSKDLIRLLKDETIIKVFCDNFAHKDKKCLGLRDIPANLCSGHLVDLEAICAKLLGSVKVPRGLSRIVTLAMPELNVHIRKPNTSKGRMKNVGRFSWIEQGKAPPLKSIRDLTAKELQYAALDAWCTLQAFMRLREVEVAS